MEMPVTSEDMWTAKYPWNTTDSIATVKVQMIRKSDAPEDIEKCLNCTEIQCWNCIAPKNMREKRIFKKTWKPF